jgi:hypothetical protein
MKRFIVKTPTFKNNLLLIFLGVVTSNLFRSFKNYILHLKLIQILNLNKIDQNTSYIIYKKTPTNDKLEFISSILTLLSSKFLTLFQSTITFIIT